MKRPPVDPQALPLAWGLWYANDYTEKATYLWAHVPGKHKSTANTNAMHRTENRGTYKTNAMQCVQIVREKNIGIYIYIYIYRNM